MFKIEVWDKDDSTNDDFVDLLKTGHTFFPARSLREAQWISLTAAKRTTYVNSLIVRHVLDKCCVLK